MATYAKVEDVQLRLQKTLTSEEQRLCLTLLEDAAVLIDALAPAATPEAKKTVSCRMVVRAVGAGDLGIPPGASQGSQTALGYSQSWTISGGTVGELYLTRIEKQLLGLRGQIGSRSPVEDLCPGGELECAALM